MQYPILGLLADRLKKAQQFAVAPGGYANPPAEVLLNLLGVPAIQQTMERVAYGEPLTTGRGMTARVRAEVAEAAMTLLPAAAGTARVAERGAMAAGRAGERMAERMVPQIMERGGMPAGLLEGMSSRTVSPLTVYHGSPAKFERFDPTKIGSGEGAQAYGYGHYVAESPGVAKDYQRRLAKESQATDLNTKMQMVDVGGKPLTSFNVDMDASLLDAAKAGKTEFVNLAESKKARWESLSQDQSYPFQDYAKQKVDAYNSLLDAAKKSDVDYTGTGMFYEIDLPDEQIARMLDWDKPMSEQSNAVKKALGFTTRTEDEIHDAANKLFDKYGPADARTPAQNKAFYDEYNALNDELDRLPPKLTGGDYYRGTDPSNYLHQVLQSDNANASMSEQLRQAGIPGIRYLDQGSRGTGEGTSNFVVFPGGEDLLTILKRNGGLLGP